MADDARGGRRFAVQQRWLIASAALLLLLALGLALFARTPGKALALKVAPGASAGPFHPIAGSFKPNREQLSGCHEDPQGLMQAFGNVSYFNGPRFAMRLFNERMRTDPTVLVICHRIAHMIGSAALAHFK